MKALEEIIEKMQEDMKAELQKRDEKIDILEKRGRKTALKYAEEHNHESCAKYLREMTGRKLIEAARLGDLQTLAAALSTISPDFVPTSTALLGDCSAGRTCSIRLTAKVSRNGTIVLHRR